MNPRHRLVLFAAAMGGLAACLGWAFAGLPGFGNYPGPYGPAILREAVARTHATGVVSAVNFSYRGIDTVGEEFILFTAAAGLSVVLRRLRGEHEHEPGTDNSNKPEASPAVTTPALVLAGPTVLIGWWLSAHAQTNPSGGFQGGVTLASALMLVYLAGRSLAFRRLSPVALLDVVEAIGAAGFAGTGLAALAMGLPYLANFLPLGTIPGAVSSGGIIPLISFFVGLEVAAAFTVIIGEFLEQTLLVRSR
ncbi:MAG: hypothetical protein J2P26_06985 [Nocardiopsaceae bacterium]|nr:hypothetical protein [Nocardiopsaceae bacterium]